VKRDDDRMVAKRMVGGTQEGMARWSEASNNQHATTMRSDRGHGGNRSTGAAVSSCSIWSSDGSKAMRNRRDDGAEMFVRNPFMGWTMIVAGPKFIIHSKHKFCW
jgi:hypothetical protein